MKIVTLSTTYTYFDDVPDFECIESAKGQLATDIKEAGVEACIEAEVHKEPVYENDEFMLSDDEIDENN